EKLKEVECKCGMGIGTGTSFCGTVGSPKRCEYAIVGDKVSNVIVISLPYLFLEGQFGSKIDEGSIQIWRGNIMRSFDLFGIIHSPIWTDSSIQAARAHSSEGQGKEGFHIQAPGTNSCIHSIIIY